MVSTKMVSTKSVKRIKRAAPRGFTLIEVLLVLAILGVIAVMVVPQLLGRQEQSMIETTQTSIRGIDTNLQMFHRDNKGRFMEGGDEVLLQLRQKQDLNEDGVMDNSGEGPWIDKYKDAWDRPFHYEWPNNKAPQSSPDAMKPAVWSDGPNGVNDNGGGDDIINWDPDQASGV